MLARTSPQANNVLIESLSSALSRGEQSIGVVPDLLKRILAEDAWREFCTRRGETVSHRTWHSFITTPPLRGLGASEELVDRIVGTADPDLLRMLREAKRVGNGTRTDLQPDSDSESGYVLDSESTAYTAQRLALEAPHEYEAVKRGERSINAAAIRSGIRKRRIPVRLDSAESAARSLRTHMEPATRRALARLLMED